MTYRLSFGSLLIAGLVAGLIAGSAAADVGFLHTRQDAEGHYLWNYPENWSGGAVPTAGVYVEIGEDTSGGPRHCLGG